MQFFDSCLQLCDIAVIADHVVGMAQTGRAVGLGLQDTVDLRLVEPVACC